MMRNLVLIASALLSPILISSVLAQDPLESLPQCALACANLTSLPAINQSEFCASSALQTEVAICVKKSCTVKENLTAQNVTAHDCGWSYHDRSSLIRYGTVTFFVLATTAVTARIISRMPCYSGPLGPDDFVIIMTWTLLATLTALIWTVSGTGLGKDIWTIPFNDITATLMYFNILTYIYILLTWLIKISILLLYLRLFPDETFRKIVKIIMSLCCIAAVSFCVACILRCHPIDFAWTFWDNEHKGSCVNILLAAQGWPHVSINICADLVVLFLPLPTIWKLNLLLEKKLGVMAMFGVGLFVTAVSIFRATTLNSRLVTSTNFTWDWAEAGLWSAIEVYVGVICACMPGIRAFYTQVYPGRRHKEMRSRIHQSSASGSSNLSSSGTLGFRDGARSKVRKDDEFELISTERSEPTTRRDPIEEEVEAERFQAPKQNLL